MLNSKSGVVYFKNLDSLRAIAAFLVIFYHIALHLVFPKNSVYQYLLEFLSFKGQGGGLGVTFFFTLSGFLITYLMFVELSKTGSFSIMSFYIRRVLRIWPLYYLTLIIGFFIYPYLLQIFGEEEWPQVSGWLYAFFLTNFDHVYTNNIASGQLGLQWSVAIEEQFYLIWPLIFTFSNKKKFPLILIVITLCSEIFFALHHDWKFRYYHTLCNIRYLSAGAFLATIAFQYPSLIHKTFRFIPKAFTLIIYLTGLLLIFFSQAISEKFHFYYYINHFISIGFFLYVIAEQTFSENRLFNLGSSHLLTRMGKISYGLYLLHMIVITSVTSFAGNLGFPSLLQLVLVLFFTILISHLSYYYYEGYFLKLKDRFSNVKTHD